MSIHPPRLSVLGTLPARLVRGVDPALRQGYGVDENTALVVDLARGEAEVLGEGAVTILDARQARSEAVAGAARIEGMHLHLLSHGDRISLDGLNVHVPDYKRPTVGEEYFDQAVVSGGGMAVSGDTLAAVLGDALLDNAASDAVERVSFSGETGVVYRFAQGRASAGFWGRDADGEARFSAFGVDFGIVPVRLTVTPLIEEDAQ